MQKRAKPDRTYEPELIVPCALATLGLSREFLRRRLNLKLDCMTPVGSKEFMCREWAMICDLLCLDPMATSYDYDQHRLLIWRALADRSFDLPLNKQIRNALTHIRQDRQEEAEFYVKHFPWHLRWQAHTLRVWQVVNVAGWLLLRSVLPRRKRSPVTPQCRLRAR